MSTKIGDRRICAFGEKAQDKLGKGIQKGAEAVASTLGPAGGNVLVDRNFRTPVVADDGWTLINNYILEDEIENLGIKSLVDAAGKASKYAEDGTSTTILLTAAIYKEGIERLGTFGLGMTPLEVRNKILEEKDYVVSELKKMAKKIETQEDLRKVAIAAYADEDMADIISKLIFQVGKNGTVIVEEGWGRETETEIVKGMKKPVKLAHIFFGNTPEGGLKLENTPILITDFDFVNLDDLSALVQEVGGSGEESLVIVGNKFENAAIQQAVRSNIVNTQQRRLFKVYLLRTPSFTPDEYKDFAIYLGGRYFSKEQGDKPIDAKKEDLGRAQHINISQPGVNEGIFIGGYGDKVQIEMRISELREKLEAEKVDMMKKRIEQRIASLAASIGYIRVASPSEGETEHIRLKTRNAKASCQSALEEGVVPGGGLALKKIAEGMPDDSILKNALVAPYEAIQRNAGGKLEIPEIYDSVKVVRTAVEQACSQAWLLCNVKFAVAFRNESDAKDAAEVIAKELKKSK